MAPLCPNMDPIRYTCGLHGKRLESMIIDPLLM